MGPLFETWHYVVDSINGDYAELKRCDIEDTELKLVARALLPAEIYEGCKLKYEMMQYTMES
ncbi:MAG: chorismate--pyruvate lyase [Lachnospiraceae bacterium]|nr:chorismate--pyruvate lyase [Lachnospiraceae bacterium]